MTNYTVPMSAIVGYGIGLLLLLVAIIAIILILRNHVKNWAYPAFIGVLFYLIFSFVIPEALVLVATFIPAIRDWGFVKPYQELSSYEYTEQFKVVYTVFRAAMDFLAIFLGMKYFLKQARKQSIYPHVGHAIAFSVTFLFIMVLLGDITTRFYHSFSDPGAGGAVKNFYQGIYIGNLINTNGFEEVVKTFVESTLKGEEATALEIEELTAYSTQNFMTYVTTGLWTILTETLVILSQGVAYVAASVFMYAVGSKKVKTNRIFQTIGMIVLIWAPYVLQTFVSIPVYATAIYYAILAALAVLSVVWLMKKEMPGEWGFMSYSRKEEKKKVEQQRNKMPTIVMPKD